MPTQLTVHCPSCGASSESVPSTLAGRIVRCARCGTQFPVPLPSVTAPPAATSTAPAPTVAEVGQDTARVNERPPAPTLPEAATAIPGTAHEAAVAPTVPEDESIVPARPTTSIAAWRPGDIVLGLYEVIALLGEGGMGRVYRVRHRGWGLDLAVKVPLPSLVAAVGGADFYEREAETWVNLGLHPHVVTCHYVRRLDGLPIVFAEYADAGSLHDAIREGRLDSVATILDIAIQFAWGLHHANAQGLVHRDVKPANVMLTKAGLAKVTDFGLARARTGGRTTFALPGAAGATLMVAGGGGVTPAYVSPEQARGETLTRRTDLWSFALSVLEMFLGSRTWDLGLAAPEVLRAYRQDGSPRGRPAMPEAIAAFLEQCFQERPDDRPHDFAEAAGVLREAWQAAAGRPYPRSQPSARSGSADALNNRAASLVDLGRDAEADGLWRQALTLEPHHVEATFNASIAAWESARISDDELLRRTEEASASHSTSSRARHLVGRVRLVLDQRTDALAAFDAAAALAPSDEIDADRQIAKQAGADPARILRGLGGPVHALAMTEDGHAVLAGSGRELRIWNAATGQLLRSQGFEAAIQAVLPVAAAGGVVVSLEGAPLAFHALDTGKLLRNFARRSGTDASLACTPRGLLLSGGSDRAVRVWDPASGRCLREMTGHEDAVTAVAAGATVLASASRDGTVRLWSLDGEPVATLRAGAGRILGLALSEDQSRVVAAGDDGVVRDWGLRSHELVRSYVSHGQAVQAIALSRDGSRILTGSTDRTVRGLDADRERVAFLARFDAAIQSILPAPDGTIWVATGNLVCATRWTPLSRPPTILCRPSSALEEQARATSLEAALADARASFQQGDLAGSLRLVRVARSIPGRERDPDALAVWDELCARLPRRSLISAWEDSRFEGHAEPVLAVALDHTRDRLATATADGELRVWAGRGRRPLLVCRGHEGAVTAVAFVPGTDEILSSGRDHTLRLWHGTQGTLLATLEAHSDNVAGLCVSPDGLRAASASWDGTVRLWQMRRRLVAHVIDGHRVNVAAVAFSADGQVLASAGWDGTARLWDAHSGAPLSVLADHPGNVTAVALHPAGRQVATGCEDGAIRLFDPRTQRPPRVLAGHAAEVTAIAFTADGRFILSSSRDKTVRVFDLRQGRELRRLPHPAMVLGLALATKGNRLLTAGAERAATLWHLDWEPDPDAIGAPDASAPTISAAAPAAASRTTAPTVRTTTLRADLRRTLGPSATLPPRARAAVGAATPWIRWRWWALGVVGFALMAASILSWFRPAPRLRLSPHMLRTVPSQIDLIDLSAFSSACSPSDYDRHLTAWRSGEASAVDVACVSARASLAMVDDVLSLPLTSPEDRLKTNRWRRNAASALAVLSGEALSAVCGYLGDEREDVRTVVAIAVGLARDGAADDCVREAVSAGSSNARSAAASALRQRLTRGLMQPDAGWRLVQRLLHDSDPQARIAGLQLIPLFIWSIAEPAAKALLADADEEVRAAARAAVAEVDAVRRTDLVGGDTGR